MVHDDVAGTLATARKEELQREIKLQQETGEVGLQEEDAYLLEVHLEDLETTLGGTEQYWLFAIRAREAQQLAQVMGTPVDGDE